MSLSASTLVSAKLIGGATRIAGNVAQRISETIGFAEVLHKSSEEVAPSTQELTDALVGAIRQRLSALGIDPNQPLSVSVTERGRLQIDVSHPRAAEIETELNSDPQMAALAGRLHRSSGLSSETIRLSIPASDLTSLVKEGNIRHSGPPGPPGGYPNW